MYRNNKEVSKYTPQIPYPYSINDAVKYIREAHCDTRKKKGYRFVVVLKQTDNVIGAAGLENINLKNKNAEIGYWLGRRYWGKGLMGETVKLILKFGFEQLKLHRIYGVVFEENIASQKVLKKSGFKFEGKLRDEFFRDKKWYNGLIYGLLNKK